MEYYFIEIISFQLLFLLVYDLFLKKETFFNWNRFYLLATAVLSIILPFIKIESFKEVIPTEYLVSLPLVILGANTSKTGNQIELDAVFVETSISTWEIVFYVGAGLATLLFVYKLIKILFLIFSNPKVNLGKLLLVKLKNTNSAFSFFHFVFLGELLKEEDKKAILKHEVVHANQLHSLDLLIFEILRILFWFNPLIYMYQNRISELHEYIADAQAVKNENKSEYYQNLLSQVFNTKKISFINPFFKQSLIKKRIVMLQKSNSKQILLLKYAMLIPMVLAMLFYTSCQSQKKLDKNEEVSNQIELLKSLVAENEGVLSEDDKAELLKLISGKQIGQYMVVEGRPNLNTSEVPFAIIDQPPIYPGCENLSPKDQKSCMSENISQTVAQNFNTKLANDLKLTGRQRINVIFKIDTDGSVVGVKSRAAHPDLEKEAIRVVKMLPKMTPGVHKGEQVIVPYSLPIIFEVEQAKKK